jgi:hypothetical protein
MIAGLTGHQQIGNHQTVQWVETQLSALLVSEGVTEGRMSLAVGADQMYAALLLRQALPYTVVLPCERYEETFSETERKAYRFYLSRAKSVLRLGFIGPSEEAFYEAGKDVVRRSDILIAVWDGLAAKGLGGTADIVHFAQSQSKRVLHVDTVKYAVRAI